MDRIENVDVNHKDYKNPWEIQNIDKIIAKKLEKGNS